MAEAEIRFIDELASVRVKPGDVLVLHCAKQLSSDHRRGIRDEVEKAFPGHKCIVLCGEIRFGVAEVSS